MKRRALMITVLLLLALLAGGGYLLRKSGVEPSAEPGEAGKVPVTALRLAPGEFVDRGAYAARLEAFQDIAVVAETGGKIVEDAVEEGAPVEKGQLLFRLEDDALRYAVKQAEAALDLARQNLLKARDASRPELISRLEALVEEREAALAKAQSDAARFDGLYRQGAVSLGQKESTDLALASARSRAKVARENLSEARTGARAEDRAAAEAAVRQAEASLLLARDALDKALIEAPLTGIVASKEVFAGDTVRPGQTVAEVVDVSAFKITVGISSDDVLHFSRGDVLQVETRGSGVLREAVVKDVGIKADDKSGSFPVILWMPNGGGGQGDLRAGMDVVVRFTREREQEVLVVPRSALIRERTGYRAFVAEDGRASGRRPEVGLLSESEAVVTGGLSAGELLIVVGQHRLKDGDLLELSVAE